jgi:hypothetical protein
VFNISTTLRARLNFRKKIEKSLKF